MDKLPEMRDPDGGTQIPMFAEPPAVVPFVSIDAPQPPLTPAPETREERRRRQRKARKHKKRNEE